MKTYQETFKDKIDMTDGTVVLNEERYKEIQKDVLQHVIKIITNDGEYGLTTDDAASMIKNKMDKLSPALYT